MLKSITADSKNAAATASSKPQPTARNVSAAPVSVQGNQAALSLQRKCDCGGGPDCDCDMGDDKKKKDKSSPATALHRAAASSSMPGEAPPIVRETLDSPGQTLDPQTRSFFEARFGHDFSGVRIHADARAGQSARAVNALAYTVGRDIAFAPGRFAPSTTEGRHLLAHELAHTLQQPGSAHQAEAPSGPLPVTHSNTPEERHADSVASRALGNAVPNAAAGSAAPRSVRRAPDPASPATAPGASPAPSAQPANQPPAPAATSPGGATPTEPSGGQPAAAPAPNPGQATEPRKIAEFDSDTGSQRHWNLKQLTTDIYTALTASDRAFVRILGVHPTKAGEDDPQGAAMGRAQVVERALIGWLGPKIPESRYDTGFAPGKIGDPQVQVWIDYKPNVVSEPKGPLPAGPGAAAAPKAEAPVPVAGAVNYAWHANLTGPKGTSKDRAIQLTIGDSRIVQLSYNIDTGQAQVLGGYQLTGDVPLPEGFLKFVNNWVKVQGFLQILAGVAAGGTTPSGSVAIAQPSAGGQVLFGSGNATVSVQVAGSVTAATAGPATAEVNVTPTFTFSF